MIKKTILHIVAKFIIKWDIIIKKNKKALLPKKIINNPIPAKKITLPAKAGISLFLFCDSKTIQEKGGKK